MAKGNIFSNLFASLFNSKDPEASKKRMLKTISKNLAKTKFHFYRFSAHEADPSLAKYFYDIYKLISPAQLMFQNTTPNAMKNVVIMSSMSDKQKLALEAFSEEEIKKLSRQKDMKAVTEELKQLENQFTSEFDNTKIQKIDYLYTKLILFSNFVQYDYYFLLKKFDSTLRERNFNQAPRFQAINGSYIAEDLKNFISIAWALPFDADWDDMFKLLKDIKGVEPISPNAWKKLLNRLRSMRDKQVFEMLIQLITEDPTYKEGYKLEDYHIIDDYVSQIHKQIDETITKIQAQQKASKVDGLASQIFGDAPVPPLKNYNPSNSSIYERKNLGSFMYCTPLGYLKQFLLEYTKKEIRELSDIILVRGEWTNAALAKPMSEAYHQLLQISERITELDNRLNEQNDLGMKLKTLLPRTERDKEARNMVQTALRDANEEAGNLIVAATRFYVTYAKNLKMALEDFVKMPKSELVMNWKDLDKFSEGNLKNMCIDVYKKIFTLVSLLQNFPVEASDDE